MAHLKIRKRSGVDTEFIPEKIVTAIEKANLSVSKDERISKEEAAQVAQTVMQYYLDHKILATVEDVQDKVIIEIMKLKHYQLAINYTTYRYQHELQRKANSTDKAVLALVGGINSEAKEENSNKNVDIIATQRDYIAGEVSRDMTRRYLLPPDIMAAHDEGLIHFHDSDYAINKSFNCCLVNLDDMLQNGTVITDTLIEKPHRFATACNVATQVIAQIASNQYGGQSISLYHLAKFVDVSRQAIRKDIREENEEAGVVMSEEQIEQITKIRLKREVKAGIQTIQYQVLTLMTTNGQAPFVTLFMYLNEAETEQEQEDLAMCIEEVLKQRYQGVKNEQGVWISPSFPKLIYVTEENNIHEDSKYFYLTELAAKCSAKRLVPDYISEKKMMEIKGDTYPCMGCVSKDSVISYTLFGEPYTESFESAWNRLTEHYKIKLQDNGSDWYMETPDMKIWDSRENDYVNSYGMIKNKSTDWLSIQFTNGRYIKCTPDHPFETNNGVILAKDLNTNDRIEVDKLSNNLKGDVAFDPNEAYIMGTSIALSYGRLPIPNEVFTWNYEARSAYLTGILEEHGDITEDGKVKCLFGDKAFAEQYMLLVQSTGVPATIYTNKGKTVFRYDVFHIPTPAMVHYTKDKEMKSKMFEIVNKNCENRFVPELDSIVRMISKEKYTDYDAYSYDVTTASEHFTVSGIYSHNCRSFLTPDRFTEKLGENLSNCKNWDPTKHKYYGRFNQGVVTINLPFVAMKSSGDMDEFWKMFDEDLELCHRALRIRHDNLKGSLSDVAPISWRYGAIARLGKGEKVDRLLYDGYSTISLGYAGLYEAVKFLTGHSHTEPEGKDLARAIMQKMNDKCAEWKEAENIDYSLYGTPLESTTYKFAKALKNKFGVVKDVSDHDYITNSYHVNVREEIDAFSKLSFEAEFQELSPGGAISYVEIPNMTDNIEAVIKLIQYMYDNIIYAELNTKSDYCQVCGYDGEIKIVDDGGKLVWECPNCGNRDQNKMNVARRTCGYIGTQFWNQGRTQEIKDRVMHIH